MDMPLTLGLQVVGMLLGAGATYGAIRADLKNLASGVKQAQESADKCHARLDSHLDHSRSHS